MVAFFPADFLEVDGRFRDMLPADFVPILYRTVDGSWYCADCLNRWRAVENPLTSDDPSFHVTGYELHYDGPPVICDGCDAVIESMFGEEGP